MTVRAHRDVAQKWCGIRISATQRRLLGKNAPWMAGEAMCKQFKANVTVDPKVIEFSNEKRRNRKWFRSKSL